MEKLLTHGLDLYKPTMSQHHYEYNRDTEVTFTFKNRGDQCLLDYVDPAELQDRFDHLQEQGWTQAEVDHLASLQRVDGTPLFSNDYLAYITAEPLPQVDISVDEDINITTTGDAPMVTFWETVVMAEVNELYFENYLIANNLDPQAVLDEGQRRLDEKIAVLKQHPDITFSDFGTRRHFSYKWQQHVVTQLLEQCPENIVGTSNVAIAQQTNTKPIGTFAHEMPMIYAGVADAQNKPIRESHDAFLRDWRKLYGDDLATALTDTFGSEFFFTDFTAQQAQDWKALRHDSGDPFEFGERVIQFYEANNIDPTTKTIIFSDGLDIETIVALHAQFKDRIGDMYGWGTTLTNDLGLKPLNIVMKATHLTLPTGEEADLVKLSDNPGKHTGPEHQIRAYQAAFAVGQRAVRQNVLAC